MKLITLLSKYKNVIFLLLLIAAVLLFSGDSISVMKQLFSGNAGEGTMPVVVIDAGHGGFDPGKVGINNALEKDINLTIALQVKELLQQNDITVIMTRESDAGLYAESDSNKKATDMKARVALIEESNAALAVSIHQNSFTQESSRGAQVFYYAASAEGKAFALLMQDQLKTTLADGNHRVAKENESYYMLRKTVCPLIIVECGFLSNPEEAALLCTEAYQRKLAWAIHLGILQQLNAMQTRTEQ